MKKEVAMLAGEMREDSVDRGGAFMAQIDGEFAFFTTSQDLGNPLKLVLIVDSGATRHISNRRDAFINFRKLKRPVRIGCAKNGAELLIEEEGDIIIKNCDKYGILRNVLYSSELSENLFSIRKIVETMNVTFTKSNVILRDAKTDEVIKLGENKRCFWKLEFELPLLNVEPSKRRELGRKLLGMIESGGSRKRAYLTNESEDIETGGSPSQIARIGEAHDARDELQDIL